MLGKFRLSRHCALAFGALWGGVLLPTIVSAAPGFGALGKSVRDDAIRSIPFDKLDRHVAAEIHSVATKPSIFRRLPLQTIDCDPRMHDFLLTNPEVVVNIWQVMGITKVQLVRTGPYSYDANDGCGAAGTIRIAYSDPQSKVIYCDGTYSGPMVSKPVRAQCVLVLRWGHSQETNQRHYVTTRCDSFIRMENMGLELIARTFQPIINKSADMNFAETAAFVSTVSRTSEVKPDGMARLGQKLTNVSPEVRQEFVTLTQAVAASSPMNRAMGAAEPRPRASMVPPQMQYRGQNARN
jgi:hypothetical protein